MQTSNSAMDNNNKMNNPINPKSSAIGNQISNNCKYGSFEKIINYSDKEEEWREQLGIEINETDNVEDDFMVNNWSDSENSLIRIKRRRLGGAHNMSDNYETFERGVHNKANSSMREEKNESTEIMDDDMVQNDESSNEILSSTMVLDEHGINMRPGRKKKNDKQQVLSVMRSEHNNNGSSVVTQRKNYCTRVCTWSKSTIKSSNSAFRRRSVAKKLSHDIIADLSINSGHGKEKRDKNGAFAPQTPIENDEYLSSTRFQDDSLNELYKKRRRDNHNLTASNMSDTSTDSSVSSNESWAFLDDDAREDKKIEKMEKIIETLKEKLKRVKNKQSSSASNSNTIPLVLSDFSDVDGGGPEVADLLANVTHGENVLNKAAGKSKFDLSYFNDDKSSSEKYVKHISEVTMNYEEEYAVAELVILELNFNIEMIITHTKLDEIVLVFLAQKYSNFKTSLR